MKLFKLLFDMVATGCAISFVFRFAFNHEWTAMLGWLIVSMYWTFGVIHKVLGIIIDKAKHGN